MDGGKELFSMEAGGKVFGFGTTDPAGLLGEEELRRIFSEIMATYPVDGKRILVLIPDHTRTMPLPVFYQLFYELVCEKAARLDFLIALGTHQPMSEDAIAKVLGVTVDKLHGKYARMRVLNHEWARPETFVEIGTIAKEELIPLTHGTIDRDVKIEVNRLAMEYDRVIVLGPVFPHEVMGYSGGTKYFFPGISGADLTNATHWVAAMQTCFATIGKPDTPQRRLIERAVERIPTERVYLCTVNRKEGVYGFFGGAPLSSWRAAVELSKQVNVVYKPRRYRLVVACMPLLYDELWTAGKGMYKLEPVVEDGGELIIYGDHIRDVSLTHDAYLNRIGYHCRDYFLSDWERWKDEPWGVIAHSTHVTGLGAIENGVEKKRIRVTLATSIPKERCESLSLGYRDPATIDVESLMGREDEGILVVPYAGETLFRLESERGDF